MSRRNVYAVYLDCSNAFNTMDQDSLLQVLYDLRFPNVAVDAVKDLYKNARTRVKTAAGVTDEINADRGVLRGDTLSPFLFNCFTEPLTRWLHVGGRGYSFGCLAKADQKLEIRCRTASCGYADDTTLLTNSIGNMTVQMQKVELYSQWGNLRLNVKKCAATGSPWEDMAKSGSPSPFTLTGCQRLQHQLAAIKIDGVPVPFAHPHKQAQRVLGVLITPTLNWKPQIQQLLAEAKAKASNISESYASSRQQLAWIQTCLKPFLTYSFPLTYMQRTCIMHLDAVFAQVAKKALRLPMSSPTALLLKRQKDSGAGAESLLVDYAQLSIAHLTGALNDTGKLGTITRSLLRLQHQWLGAHTTRQVKPAAGHLRLIKQLELMHQAGLTMRPVVKPDREADTEYDAIFARPARPDAEHLDLSSIVGHVHTDPRSLGESRPIPATVYHSLAELGIRSLKDLLCKNKKAHAVIISTSELKLRYGKAVRAKHCRALNHLTSLLYAGPIDCAYTGAAPGRLAPTNSQLRTVHPDVLDAEFQKHGQHKSIEGDWRPDQSTTHTQLIHTAFERALHAPSHGEAAPRLDIIVGAKRGRDKRRKFDTSYAIRVPIEARTCMSGSPQLVQNIQKRSRRRHPIQVSQQPQEQDAHAVGRIGKRWEDWLEKMSQFIKARSDVSTRDFPDESTSWPNSQAETVRSAFQSWITENKQRRYTHRATNHRGITINHIQTGLFPADRKVWRRPTSIRRSTASLPELEGLYRDQNYIWKVMAKCQRRQATHFLVRWQPTFIIANHIEQYKHACYNTSEVTRVQMFGPQVAKWLRLASWQDTWEPEESVREHPHLEADLLHIDCEALLPKRKRPWPQGHDTALNNLQRQSFFDPALSVGPDPLAKESALQALISIETGQTVNPDFDIVGTGAFTIAKVRADDDSPVVNLCAVHDPDGSTLSTITVARLTALYSAFCRSRAMGDPAELPIQEFPQELAKLISRYREGSTHSQYCIKSSNFWATPKTLMDVIKAGFGITQERFACPLDFEPTLQSYYSPFPEDARFGAQHDAYSCKWTGASQAMPESSAQEMQKAVRWAIGSAMEAAEPSLTVFVLPFHDKTGTSYQQWLGHPLVHNIAKIPKRAIKLQAPEAWKTGQTFRGHPRWDYLLFAVANNAGIQQFVQPHAIESGLKGMMTASQASFEYDIPRERIATQTQTSPHEHSLPFFPPRHFTNELPASEMPTRSHTEVTMDLPDRFLETKPLRWQANQIIYTDGSIRDTDKPEYYRCGAGVHRPASDQATSLDICIDPIDDQYGVANTIQRAEAVAIQHALEIDHSLSSRVIATDSLCVMYMLSKQLRSPSLHKESKHLGILESAVDNVMDKLRRGQRIRVIKVKSHIGIKGNEKADQLAHDACETRNCHVQVLTGLPIREKIHWPIQSQPDLTGPPSTGENDDHESNLRRVPNGTQESSQGEEGTPGHQVNDLRKGMKTLIKARLAAGYANQTTYVKAWEDIQHHIVPDFSSHFWNNSCITMPAITQVLRYRFGQLWNMKLAYRQRRPYLPGMRPPRNACCPHCGREDSGGHILGGCQHAGLKAMYISRHDAAMRKVLKAITRGPHGSFLKIADIGRDELVKDLGIVSKRIPPWLLTDADYESAGLSADRRQILRPDILIIEVSHAEQVRYSTAAGQRPLTTKVDYHVPQALQARAPKGNRAIPHDASRSAQLPRRRIIWLLEGGYTSDTRYEEKFREKQDQHRTLIDMLESKGFEVRLGIVALGVSGTIYRTTQHALKDVGIETEALKKLLRSLHQHAVESLHGIVVQRRKLDSTLIKHQSRRPP